jgi:hypothetical protein
MVRTPFGHTLRLPQSRLRDGYPRPLVPFSQTCSIDQLSVLTDGESTIACHARPKHICEQTMEVVMKRAVPVAFALMFALRLERTYQPLPKLLKEQS